ncbi:hypothetical protein [Collimonas fungivorans]|uniref:hypothetical protein n=1 Tax=Collimonas fungivorans TaxID=158899 RepID=UPI0011D2B103|nr:hypothetical protein [Collimonas fungivorans]
MNFLRAFCRNFTLTPLSGPRSTCFNVKRKKLRHASFLSPNPSCGSESPGGTFTLAGIFQLHRRQAGVLDKKIGANTIYGSAAHEAPMKTFIQERIATLVLAQNDLEVATMDFGVHGGIFTRIFSNDQRTRRLLQTCDLLKQLYCASGDEEYLSTFRKTRALVPTKFNLLS